jgi:hypothetical protein
MSMIMQFIYLGSLCRTIARGSARLQTFAIYPSPHLSPLDPPVTKYGVRLTLAPYLPIRETAGEMTLCTVYIKASPEAALL